MRPGMIDTYSVGLKVKEVRKAEIPENAAFRSCVGAKCGLGLSCG